MATRRNVNTQPKESLDDMIKIYAGKKEELDPLKKMVDEYGKKIKSEMTDRDLPEYTVGDVKASISVTPKEDFNELQAIEILRKSLTPEQFSKAVKTKEYLDDDAFEPRAAVDIIIRFGASLLDTTGGIDQVSIDAEYVTNHGTQTNPGLAETIVATL